MLSDRSDRGTHYLISINQIEDCLNLCYKMIAISLYQKKTHIWHIHDDCEGLNDWQHHGGRGRVGDEHGDEGRRDHEAEHDHLGRSSQHQDDPQSDPLVQAGVLDAHRQHQTSEHHKVGRFHVVHRDFALKKLNFIINSIIDYLVIICLII
jgi:hypothetical protein